MIKAALKRLRSMVFWPITMFLDPIREQLDFLYDVVLTEANTRITAASENPLSKFGRKIFSQTDEDGITIEILKRIGIEKGSYAEFGVGDGLENNTIVLAALGWSGFWVGNQVLAFNPPANSRFRYSKQWITLENIVDTVKQTSTQLGIEKLDVVSLDLDGNDFYFVERLLQNGVLPSLFIVEYNAKLAPPIEFKIDYDPNHTWNRDDYFGASLSTYNRLFEGFNYRLVCCNPHTGANAFFVRNEYAHLFEDVPKDIEKLFVGPRFYLYRKFAHGRSGKTVEVILKQGAAN